MAIHTIPARRGLALQIKKGHHYKVINTHGYQIVDHWAFNADDPKEFMSMEHCHVAIDKLTPVVGDSLVTNKRRPIITLLEDSSPGVHDTVIAACDIYRYQQLGAKEYHDNCTDNLHAALDFALPCTPSPLNLFENARPAPDGTIEIAAPVAPPGSHVTLRAELDVTLVLSACPQDMAATNGPGPTDAAYRLTSTINGA